MEAQQWNVPWLKFDNFYVLFFFISPVAIFGETCMEYIGVIQFRTVLADFLLQLVLGQTLDWLDYKSNNH